MPTLLTTLNTFTPVSMAVAHDGVLYVANGLNVAYRWDGESGSAELAGVARPASCCDVAAKAGAGDIYGSYTVYVRYVDDDDVPSSFSEASTTVVIASASPKEGFDYTNVPSGSGRYSARQVWRSTAGQGVTFYLDVDDASASDASTRTDGELVLQQSLRFVTEEGWPNANRFTPPPDWASVVVSFGDRTWWAVPVDFTWGDGTTNTSTTHVSAEGVRFTQQMIGRQYHAAGYLAREISAVPGNTSLTLVGYRSDGFGTPENYYSVSPSGDHRNKILFSEAAEPESVPSSNEIILQPDGDQLTGLMPYANYLYLLKHRHIYRLSTAGDPRRDAAVTLAAGRGCLNQRCWCEAEGVAYLMDRAGCYAFDGAQVQSISGPIQDKFRREVNWNVSKWFHVVPSLAEETVRFFVATGEDSFPTTAFCFNYRLQQWHEEPRPYQMLSSAVVPLNSKDRVVVGAEEKAMVINEGLLDGCAPYGPGDEDTMPSITQTVRGTVTEASTTWLKDSAGDFNFEGWLSKPQDTGAPIYVIAANGDSQMQRIASISSTTTTITAQLPWTTIPSVGDTYQIGGIAYEAKVGTFRYPEREEQTARRVGLRYEPQSEAGKVNLRTYHDHSSTARAAVVPHDNNLGLEITADSANVQLDLTQSMGYHQHRFSDGFEAQSPAARMLEVELKGVSGAEKSKFFSLDIDGVEA